MTERDRKRLAGCRADLILRVERVFNAMAVQGWTMMVTDGARDAGQQFSLWTQGRALVNGAWVIVDKAKVVTYADGSAARLSRHQRGEAADCCFVIDGKPSWHAKLPWLLYGECAEQEGLEWGGRWPAPKTDQPHIQLPLEGKVLKV